jgi:dipeptidyl aminopeptidase/acylaminoacyl peptidase
VPGTLGSQGVTHVRDAFTIRVAGTVRLRKMRQIVSGYGTWKSPLTAARVTAGLLRFDHLVVDGDDLYWTEGRAAEGGRYVVVRRTPHGSITDVTPAEFNVRTRVHEYGGAAYTVHHGTVYFSNFTDQRLYRQEAGKAPHAITKDGFFYAEPCVDAARARLVCVREDHRGSDVVNEIAAVAFDGSREHVLARGADFYSDPIVSPDASQLAWLQWNHPNMPWDGTELWVAALDDTGMPQDARRVAGGVSESIFQPLWSPAGELFYVSDRSGWWNLYRKGENVLPMPAEFGKPQWVFSQTTYCFIDAQRIAATYTERGQWKLGILDLESRAFERVNCALAVVEGIRAIGDTLYFIGGSPTDAMCIAAMPRLTASAAAAGPADSAALIIRSASSDRIPLEWISVAQSIEFESDGVPVHAFYYPPTSPDYVAPEGERPPLIVVSHGGPTAVSFDILDARVQFWTSRGFAMLDVNYGGSTGFGRAYRDRLKGTWGLVDVADCVNGALHLVRQGLADANRLAIRGGSAGGYTTLAALTFYDTFKAGASHYGVSDVEVLAQDTHKFESRYLDSLIGPYPEARDLYRARSPIHHTDRLSAALILFQGLEDKVVPPNQAEMMAEAVRRKGLPVAYVPFEGEQHGFRKAENIIRSLEAELYFYGVVFGFTPADPIEPVAIANV